MTLRYTRKLVALGLAAGTALVFGTAGSASAADLVSQASAQAVNLNLASGALTLAISNPATKATNDGTQSNAVVNASPLISLLNGESFLEAGALKESAEANQDGSSYACSGVVSPGGDIQIGSNGQTCTATGSGTGGVTIDLGALPGLGTLGTAAGGDIKITIDALVAHGYVNGAGPATLDASVADVEVQLGTATPIPVTIPAGPNQDLLGAVLSALAPSLGALGTTISNLIKGIVSLTTNYQPNPEPNASGVYSVSALHVALLGGGLGTADLAHVTVGPNVPSAAVDAFSFENLPIVLAGLVLVLGFGMAVRKVVQRVRA